MKKRKIFWGIFFVVMAMVVIVSKIGILPDVGVFSGLDGGGRNEAQEFL